MSCVISNYEILYSFTMFSYMMSRSYSFRSWQGHKGSTASGRTQIEEAAENVTWPVPPPPWAKSWLGSWTRGTCRLLSADTYLQWWRSRQEEDPLLEPPDSEVMIGTCQLVLQPLAFNVELSEQLELSNYRGQPAGVINVRTIAYRNRH